jgi:1,4-dihydroxy-2-naphthoate polyprenyltransferase
MSATRTLALGRLRPFFELGKLKIVELWLGFFVGVTLLGHAPLASPRALAVLALILVAGVAVIAATCSLDDIAGVRDGVDQANHRDGARWGVSKPILTGHLAERQAFGFVRLLGAVAVVATVGTVALAWPLPAWLVATIAVMMLVAVNYSYGLKLSYHGAGELVIFIGGAGTVLLPYALVAKAAPAPVIASALLVGAWHAQVVMFSNTNDAAGDRATGRMTMAARSSERGNRLYIAALFALGWAATVAAFVAGWIPAWYFLPLAPVWAMQARQLWLGLGQRRWLAARLTGFRVLRAGIVGLALANLLFRR